MSKKNDDGSNWFKDTDDFKAELAKLSVSGGDDIPETAIDALEMARQLDLRTSSQKFFILVTDAGYKVANNYGIQSMSEMIDLLVDSKINVSVVSNLSYQSTYKSLYERTGGVFANVSGNFKKELLSIADLINEETNSGCWVALNGLTPQIVKLDEKPTINGTADTDEDGKLDKEELMSIFPMKYIEVDGYLYFLGLPLNYEYPYIPVYEYYTNPTLEDTDYDGINDNQDDILGNEFTYNMKDKYAEYPVTFEVDYRLFFKDNTNYREKLAVLGTVYANLAYHDSYLIDQNDDTRFSLYTTYYKYGLKNIDEYKISEYYQDDNISEMTIGHRKVNYNSQNKEIIVVSVRGTDSTIEEWSSNFDVGADTDDYWDRNNPFWRNKLNHKGFDVATNRLYDHILEYVKRNVDKKSKKVIYIVGHSRGAAIANILGAKFESSENYESFVYTYATPNTTTDYRYGTYETIFNIVNEDDLVPQLPLAIWSFHKYGRTYSTSATKNYENKIGKRQKGTWEWLFGEDYNYNGNLKDTIKEFKTIANNRESLYKYIGEDDTIYSYSLSYSQYPSEECRKQKEKFGERLERYCNVQWRPTFFYYSVNVEQTPAFFMMVLADLTANKCHDYSNGTDEIIDYKSKGSDEDTFLGVSVSFYVAKKYKKAKKEFIHSDVDSVGEPAETFNVGGMVHGHMPGTYYFLANDYYDKLKEVD